MITLRQHPDDSDKVEIVTLKKGGNEVKFVWGVVSIDIMDEIDYGREPVPFPNNSEQYDIFMAEESTGF